MTPIARTLALAVALAPLSGCLESGRTGGSSDTVQSDTTVSQDTSVSQDTAVVDVIDCSAINCDDGDPCTWDECDPTTGQCMHYQAPAGTGVRAPSECEVDADCEDGDPCSYDTCQHVDDGCGYRYSYCTSDWADGCYGCQETGCDDGNPCTVDTCRPDGTCEFTPGESCAFSCSGAGVTPHQEAMYGPYGQAVKLAGIAKPDPQAVCDTLGCSCETLPALIDENGSDFLLHGAASTSGADEVSWVCEEAFCDNLISTCSPTQYGVAYWVWGTTQDRWSYVPYSGGSDGAAVPIMPQDVLSVWDYCLQTNAAGLVGHYTGTFTTSAFWDTTFDLVGDIRVVDGQLTLTLSEPECPSCGQTAISYFFPQTVPVHAGDGWISFEIEVPTMCNAILPPPDAILYSHKNTLSGVYHDKLVGSGGSSGDVAYCAYGDISLTRAP